MNTRFLALALAGTLSLGLLTACGGGSGAAPETTPPAVESAAPSPQTPEDSVPPVESPETTPAETPGAETPQETDTVTPPATPAPQVTARPSAPPASSAPRQTPSATPTPVPVEPEPQVDVVASTWNAIAQLELPALMDVDSETLTALYGIDPADLVSYVCKIPAVSVQATEFFIAQVQDGRMDAVRAAVEQRQADLEEQWSQYLPEQLELVQNYRLVTSGNYILFAISEHADEAVSAFDTYTN